MPSSPNRGITRRDLLKKGAILGGAVVWVTPIVQSVGMGRAFAQTTSPCTPPISYIAMNVICVPPAPITGAFFIKWEADEGEFGEFEPEPKSVPDCSGIFTPGPPGGKMDGDDLGFMVSVDPGGIATVTVPEFCTVLEGVVKGEHLCDLIPNTSIMGPVTFPVGCPTSPEF